MPTQKQFRPYAGTHITRSPGEDYAGYRTRAHYALFQRSRDYSLLVTDDVRRFYLEQPAIDDHFLGNAIDVRWKQGGGTPVAFTNDIGGWLQFTDGIQSACFIDFGNISQIDNTVVQRVRIRAKLSDLTQETVYLGLYNGSGSLTQDFIWFTYTPVGSTTTWLAEIDKGGTVTSTSTGITATTSAMLFEIYNYSAIPAVAYFIDEVLVATMTANIPTVTLQPILYIKGKDLNSHTVKADFYRLWMKQSAS